MKDGPHLFVAKDDRLCLPLDPNINNYLEIIDQGLTPLKERKKVLVVGAGIAGLTAAHELERVFFYLIKKQNKTTK